MKKWSLRAWWKNHRNKAQPESQDQGVYVRIGKCCEFNVYVDGTKADGGIRLDGAEKVFLPKLERNGDDWSKVMTMRLEVDALENAIPLLTLAGKWQRIEVRAAVTYLNAGEGYGFHGHQYIMDARLIRIEQSTVERNKSTAGVFNMLRSLSETVIVPIAGAILALIMCYELIQLIAERNNMHDMDSWMLFRWVFKSAAAVLLVANTWNIVMGVFDLTQSVVNQSAGVIIGNTSIDITAVVTDLENRLSDMDIGGLLGLWFQSLFVGLTMNILSICIMLVVYGRLIEIYLVTSLGPIPLATIGNSEWRGMGQGYLKSLFALGFQAFLIMVVTGIYAGRYRREWDNHRRRWLVREEHRLPHGQCRASDCWGCRWGRRPAGRSRGSQWD